MYETSPSYWQVLQESGNNATAILRPHHLPPQDHSDAFSNFQVTDDRACLTLSLDVSARAKSSTLLVEVIRDEADPENCHYLRISATVKGQTIAVGRPLRSKKWNIQDIKAFFSIRNRVLTIEIPKIAAKKMKVAKAGLQRGIHVPVTDADNDDSRIGLENISPQPSSHNHQDDVKRLVLEVPASIKARDLQVVFDPRQGKLCISAGDLFQNKFNINPDLIDISQLRAEIEKIGLCNSNLLVISAPNNYSKLNDTTNQLPARQVLPIQEADLRREQHHNEHEQHQHHHHGSHTHHHSTSAPRHRITSSALALSNSSSSTSAIQLQLEYQLMELELLENNAAAVEAAVDFTADAARNMMMPSSFFLQQLV
jgi:hypothetical protein